LTPSATSVSLLEHNDFSVEPYHPSTKSTTPENTHSTSMTVTHERQQYSHSTIQVHNSTTVTLKRRQDQHNIPPLVVYYPTKDTTQTTLTGTRQEPLVAPNSISAPRKPVLAHDLYIVQFCSTRALASARQVRFQRHKEQHASTQEPSACSRVHPVQYSSTSEPTNTSKPVR
jgi:hypothetical protein